MAVVVVDEGEGVVVEFGGEAEGIGKGAGACGGDGAEGGVVVVRGDAVLRGVVEDLRDVLVAVVRIEEVESPVLGAHGQGPRGDGLCGVPHKLRPHGVPLRGIQPLDAGCRKQSGSAWRPDRLVSLDSPRGGPCGRKPW